MLSSKIISLFYIKIRQSLKKLLFFIFSENSKMINFFVIFDIFLRRLGFLNYFLKGRFEYEGLIFCNDKNDTSIESSILTNQTYEPELLEEIRSNINICCAVTMEPDEVEDLIDKLKDIIKKI